MDTTSMKITPIEYAVERGITLQAVTKMIRDKGKLPGISRIEKYGRFYVLTKKRGKKDK